MVEIPSPSGKEQSHTEYIRAEMQKLGLADIRMDDMLNVSGVRKGSGGGPTVVFAAHTDSVFPEGTPFTFGARVTPLPHLELVTTQPT